MAKLTLISQLISVALVAHMTCEPASFVGVGLTHIEEGKNKNSNLTHTVDKCDGELLNDDKFILLQNGTVYISFTNKAVERYYYSVMGEKLCVFQNKTVAPPGELTSNLNCTKTWTYDTGDFEILPNGSVSFDGFVDDGPYEMIGDKIKMCQPDDAGGGDVNTTMAEEDYTLHEALIYVGRTGTTLSIIALCLHLLVFALVPSIRNLPGYSLASLSVAYLLAYCFVMFGQISEVLGTSCVVSASLQHFFFLSAFFWMNAIAFDVWKALRLATRDLVGQSRKIKIKKFCFYSIYSWGIPLCIAITAVTIDSSSNLPDTYKPLFGHEDICWFTNDLAKEVFFAIPAFTLFLINGIFFILSAYMIVHNTAKDLNDEQRAAKLNFTLYIRLGLIMGVPWLVSIAGVIFKRKELWFVFDVLNSLQGVFIFILFSCTKKVWSHLKKLGKNRGSTTADEFEFKERDVESPHFEG